MRRPSLGREQQRQPSTIRAPTRALACAQNGASRVDFTSRPGSDSTFERGRQLRVYYIEVCRQRHRLV